MHVFVFKSFTSKYIIRLHLLLLKRITALITLTKVKHILFIHGKFKYLNWKVFLKINEWSILIK